MIKITCVKYINSTPFIDGLTEAAAANPIVELSLDMPSEGARKIRDKQVDIGLVPVAVLPQLPEYSLVSHFCISALREVKSVCVFSEVPLDEITDILLDYQSLSSVTLVQVLNRFHWKKNIRFLPAPHGFIDDISGTVAGVVIGDRTFGLHEKFRYVYDLSEEWYRYTGLPFVFAAWVSVNPALKKEDVEWMNAAFEKGIQGIEKKKDQLMPPLAPFDYYGYLTQNIHYNLGDAERKAMQLFHSLMGKL
jgi:chorismate dehydratase